MIGDYLDGFFLKVPRSHCETQEAIWRLSTFFDNDYVTELRKYFLKK
jgi:hypothetical protein